METTKKLSLDDIFGKASAPASSEAVKSIDDIFGHKEAATPVAPYGTMTDEIRGVSHAPADLVGVSPQPVIIGENELQKNRAGFEKELKSTAGAIQPTQDSFKPMSADAFKVGGDVTMPGAVDKPKSLSQTVQSEINKRWGGDLQSIIDKARSVNPENVNLAEDMESHFWKVMKDKVPSDSFITQEDLDGFKFTRDYSNGDKDIEYSFGHYTYPQEVVNEYVARHNDEVLHNMRFKEEPEYRNEWFLRNVGVTEQAYRDEVAADLENRLQELRKKVVATLPAQHTRGGYAAIGAAANKPSSGAPVSIEKIDKALETVNTLRKNSFGAGLKEGFDLADILTLGVSGIGENVALLNALNKSVSGKTLTTSEQALVEAWDIQNEAEEVMQVLGGRSLASNIGRGGAQSLGFITQTVGTGGLASAATKGITRAAAKSALKRVASTGVASKIQEGVRYGSLKAAESLVGAAARTPFMGFTYRNYTDKRLNQFQINERVDEATGEISKYIDKQESSALRDAAHAALESYFESQSEDVGGLIDFGITSFARALPIKQFIRSSVVNGMTGAVKNGAMKWIKESAKIYGLAGEVLSEAYGDAAVNLLTSNTDGWKQMASSEYWWELLGVSSMLSGGFGVVNRAVNSYSGRNLDRQIAREDNNRRNALSRIEDDMLKKELTEVSLTDDLIERSKMLSSLDWSNFTKEDMANTIDFISAQTRLDVMRESDMESRRLARIMPAIDEVKTLADNGALDEDQAAASLAVIYGDLFRTQENQRALNILTDRIKVAADAGISADEINEILRGAGLTVFNPGDEIETLTGDRAIVDKVLPGAYVVVNNEGDRAVVSFEEVLQNTPEVRQIQQESNQTEGQTESAPENNPQVEQAVADARAQVAEIINKDDNAVYEVETDDGITGYIIGGKGIVVDNDGRINQSAEDTVVVKTDEGNRVVHKERVKVKNHQTLQEIEDLARGAAEGALAAVQPQQPDGGKTYQGIYNNEQVTITLPREIKFNEDGTVDYDNLMNPETVSVIRPNGDVVDEVGLNEIEQLAEVQPEAEQVSADAPAVEQQEVTNLEPDFSAIRPVSIGDFGPIYDQFRGNAKDAIALLLQRKDGEAVGALSHPEVGEIDLVWGREGTSKSDGYGLSKLAKYHPEVLGNLQEILNDMKVASRTENRVQLESDTHKASVRLTWNEQKKNWLLTAFEKKEASASIGKKTDTDDNPKDLRGDTALSQNTDALSDNKDTTSEPNNQEVAQKNVTEAAPVVQQPQIPLLKNGEPDYNAMDAQMFAEQYVARFGEGATERIARNNIKASNKTISTIEKQIEDVTDPNKMPALYSKLQDAQATKDKYSAVLEELGLSADESEDNAARIQRKKQENTPWFNKLFPDGFPNVESVILWDIANGNRIRWTNKEVNGAVVSKGLGSHLGLADSNAERTRRVALIGKDAPTPEEYAEQLPERLNAMGIRFEESELLDKVLDVYASVDTVRKAKEELEKISASIQSKQEGLDYEEEQMRRNYEREQEALRQEAQADVVDEQTEQEQPTNEETQEEELSIEDEVPFMVSSDSVQTTNEAQQLATEAAITALEDAGVEVVNATPKMVEEALQRKDVQVQAVNQKFNEQLDSFTEENANAVIFDLGMPSPMLIAGGVPNKPIRLYGSKLLKKIRKHGFSAAELSGLPMALANPIAVFNNYQREGNRSVLIELSTADGNFLVSIDIGAGSDIDFDIVKSVFGKDGDGILNWINKGYLTTVDKEKALAYLRISAPIAEASNKQELDSATKIVENFENPNIVPDNSFSIGSAPVFVSNAKIAVLGIKQEKATPEQWLKMIEKAGGLKAGEDKWIGLSDWLKASDKKTLTKREVLDYINENQIQIEETTYSSNSAVETTPEFKALQEEFKQLVKSYEDEAQRNLDEYEAKLEKKYNFTDTFDTTVLNSDESKAHSSLSRAVGEAYNAAWVDFVDRYGDDFEIAFWRGYDGIRVDNAEAAGILLGLPIDRPIYHMREDYTTNGLEGNREIALTVPNIESWRETDEIHFGDAGDGRAIAWVRFGETTDSDGKRVLVIDEVQSKRHQEGREKGYRTKEQSFNVQEAEQNLRSAVKEFNDYRDQLKRKYDYESLGGSIVERSRNFMAALSEEERNEFKRLNEQKANLERTLQAHREVEIGIDDITFTEHDGVIDASYGDYISTHVAGTAPAMMLQTLREQIRQDSIDNARRFDQLIPDAPFDKNWADLAMKRMLRYAAENGFDKVAWTKGNQQAERYNIGSAVRKIVSYTEDGAKTLRVYIKNNEPLILKVDSEGKILYSNGLAVLPGQNLSDVVGKDVAVKILRGDGEDATIYAGKGKEYAAKQLSGNNLRIGGEGMRAFYDQMLPSFMRKYGKKWGATVQDVTLPNVEEAGRTMHSVDVTDSMRESVMQGQPMFYRRPNGTVYGWTNGTTVYLTESGMNPNTPIHEYTHIWADAMRKHNPDGWASIVKLLKGTPVWNEVMADANYANIHSDEHKVASEALSRISGRENSAKMEAMAQQMIDENANDTVKKNRARKLLDRMRKALQEFWSWVGKELFGIKNFESIEQVTDRILYDLVSGTDLTSVSSFDTPAAEHAEEVASNAQKIADKFGLSNEIVVAETPEVFVNELQSENVADGLINPDAIAVFTPSGRIMVNAQMISDIAELPDSIMHEFAHNVTHIGSVLYRLQDTVLEVGEERFEVVGREIFGQTADPLEVADEIIATFVGNAANPTLYDGEDLVSRVFAGYSTEEAIRELLESLPPDLHNGYADVVEAVMPYVKEVLDAIKTNHDGPRKRTRASEDYRDAQAKTGRVRISVQGYSGRSEAKVNRFDNEPDAMHATETSVHTKETFGPEGVNEFSIGSAQIASEAESQSGQENALTPQEDKAKDKALKQLDRLNKVINSLRQTVKQAERDNVDLANVVQAALEEEVKDGGINRFLDVSELISLIRSGLDKKSIESTMDRLSERLTDAIIKNREEQLAQLLQVQVQGTNAFGIPIGYAVDDDTRAMVEFFRENLSRDMNKIVEAMASEDDKSLKPYNKSELNVWFTAYKEIEESRYNIKATQKDIDHETERSQSFYRLTKELKAKNAPEGQIKIAQEHRRQALRNKKAQKKAILVAKQTLAQELEGMIFLLGGRLRDGRAIRAGRLSADKVYAKNFLTEAMADVRVNDGTKTFQGTKEELAAKAKFHKDIRVRTAAYRSYAYMIQSVSRNAIGGKGFLWDALMEGKNGWVDCNDKRLAMDNIDNQEILANVQASGLKSVADLQRLFDKQLVDKNGNPYVFRYETDRTGRIDQDIRPTIGWATYIVLCFEQDDMAPTMEKMRITEEQIQQIRDMLPEAAKNFLKWSRKMLEDRRQRIYNPASLERFGTQMANIPNYFPIRRLEKNLHKVEEVEQVASADSDQVTIMANALIKRVRNVVEIDFQQNPLELLKNHLERMNGFAANVPLARNVNILLNSSGFRDQLNEQGDPNTYEYFKTAAKVALSSYKPKPGALDSVMIELQGWLAAGKIAWRFFTALKQLLSLPAFWSYNVSLRYKAIFIRSVLWPAVKNGDEGKLVAIWKWGMDNIPQLKERWSSRYAGNEKLAQVKDTLFAQYIAKHALLRNTVGKIGEWGMIPNAAVDLFACSIGCYAVYKFELEQLQKKGYSKEEADELAKRRASIAFNESQQSSESAFIAPLQRDRTFLAVQVSLFNNSNFGYGRKEKLARKYLWQQTFNKDLREKRLVLAKKRYLERFLNEERNRLVENNNKIADVTKRLRPEEIDRMVESKRAEFSKRAEKEANRDAKMAYAKGVEDVVMFKWLLNMAWQMAPTAVAYWLSCAMREGDDEDPQNPLNAETLALMFATATFRNAIGGGVLESALNGYGFTGLVGSEVEKTVDILAQALQPLWLTDEEAESFDPLAVWMAVKQCLVMGTGFDVNVFTNIFTGLVGLFNDRSRTTADVLRILNAPKSMIREIEIVPFEDETLDNYTRRMAMMENVALDRMEELKEKPSSELNATERRELRKMKKWEKNLITIRQAEAAGVPYSREVDGRVVAAELKQLDTDYADLLKSLDLTQSGKNRAGKVELTEDERRRKKALRVVTRVKGIRKMEESAAEVINNPEAYRNTYRQIVEEKRTLIEEWNQ